jgi:hypothetical protein
VALSNPSHPEARFLLDQMMLQIALESIPQLRQTDVPWRVYLEGEGATDAGGPGRDLFSQMCIEIQHPSSSLFRQTATFDQLVPCGNASKLRHYTYVGVLIGLSIWCKLPEPFHFMPLVWDFLAGDPLPPGGQELAEIAPALLAMREGLNLILRPAVCFMFTGRELELLACGDKMIPVSELKKFCRVEDDPGSFADLLWEALERFTPKERVLFLKFVCGRSGLPPPGHAWEPNLTIRFLRRYEDDGFESHLSTAVTCSSALLLPLYPTVDIMERKIRTAITFSGDIDTDRSPDRSELVALI